MTECCTSWTVSQNISLTLESRVLPLQSLPATSWLVCQQATYLRLIFTYYYTSSRVSKRYCDQHVCLSVYVCLSTNISQKLHVQIVPDLLYILSVDVAWYPLMASVQSVMYFWFCMLSYNGANGTESKMTHMFVQFTRWRHRGRSLQSPTASFIC